jgi:hypothetical protein
VNTEIIQRSGWWLQAHLKRRSSQEETPIQMTLTKAFAAGAVAIALALAATSPTFARPCTQNSTSCQVVWKGKNSTIYSHDNGTYYECTSGGCTQL